MDARARLVSVSDICILSEGSYPYVSGGVASAVHQLIRGYPQYSFDLVILQARSSDPRKWRYDRLDNIKNVSHVPLQDGCEKPLFLPVFNPICKDIKQLIAREFRLEEFENFYHSYRKKKPDLNLKKAMIYSQESYDLIEEIFHEEDLEGKSFLQFFWMMRSLVIGYINCMHATVPRAKVFHTVSTGYSGLLAGMLSLQHPGSRLMLTEHGIYTRERKMEIATAHWPDMDLDEHDPQKGAGFYKKIWSQSFRFMSQFCYRRADSIISLYGKNNEIQIKEGAPLEKVKTIRNGIDINRFSYRHRETMSDPPKIGFLGRVVRIKDVKTFIRAAALVCFRVPEAQFLIAGGYDEDPEYFEDCKKLMGIMKMENNVHFLGKVNAKEFFEDIDLMVLTSLSEGQPLVMLEAAACGIPMVATDVGGCKEIMVGGAGDKLGRCGIVTQQTNPRATSEAILNLINNKGFYSNCSRIGRSRVEQHYSETLLLEEYGKEYAENLQLASLK